MNIVRPKLSENKREELETYLLEQFERAKQARETQVGQFYASWNKNYYGTPAEKTRTVPWYKSSNFVVKIVRMFVETFTARTLNLIFATRPLIAVDMFPTELRDPLQFYLDRKAREEWDFWTLMQRTLIRGAKNGTVVIKTTHVEDTTIDVTGGGTTPGEYQSETITKYIGPKPKVIPFDDIFFYPITACDLSEVEIKFQVVRYTEEAAIRKVKSGKWLIDEDDVIGACRMPQDIKRSEEREDAGIYDRLLKEFQMVECHLEYAVENDEGKSFSIIAMICPELRKLVDVYFNPYPGNYETFAIYTPSPREDCIFGESWSEILGQSQEEISQIHNDRRNSSFLTSAPVFKRKNGSNLPNPSTNWYPGKVFDLDDIDDLDIMNVGGHYADMIGEEMHVISLAERLMGIGAIMQGGSSGSSDKRGVYNTGGVLAMMSEGNQRQDTNIRDARNVLSQVAKCCYFLQTTFAANDPLLEFFPKEMAAKIKQAFSQTTRNRINYSSWEIKASSAASNKEIEKSSLLQMANFLGQHAKTLLELTPQAVGAMNPTMKYMTTSVMNLSSWMAKRLMAAYDEYDTEGVLPDVRQILSGGAQAPVPGAAQEGMDVGGSPEPGAPVNRQLLQQMAAMGGQNGGGPPQ